MASRTPDGTGGPHAFVADLQAPVLEADDRQHLERVLRLRAGDPLTICDGEGRWRDCRFDEDLQVVGEVVDVSVSSGEVTVGFSMLKGGRPELVVQKLTELGVDRIIPLLAERSVVRWDADKCATQHERFLRVAREAAMQSRRIRLPGGRGDHPGGRGGGPAGNRPRPAAGPEPGGRRPDRPGGPRGRMEPRRGGGPRCRRPRSDRAAGRDCRHRRRNASDRAP